MTASKTVPVYHHVDGIWVTCRRPASQGGSLTAKWGEVTCDDCLTIGQRRRSEDRFTIFVIAVILGVLLLVTAAIVESVHYHHACSDAGGVVVRGDKCVDKSVVIEP